ncbi:hypothetical protein LIA77_06427 [Sarocladium implicatum]|nr:hypothetical protein LIA77_06427 [Sarocladium implicatum]
MAKPRDMDFADQSFEDGISKGSEMCVIVDEVPAEDRIVSYRPRADSGVPMRAAAYRRAATAATAAVALSCRHIRNTRGSCTKGRLSSSSSSYSSSCSSMPIAISTTSPLSLGSSTRAFDAAVSLSLYPL